MEQERAGFADNRLLHHRYRAPADIDAAFPQDAIALDSEPVPQPVAVQLCAMVSEAVPAARDVDPNVLLTMADQRSGRTRRIVLASPALQPRKG
jgi:hypothetical protein